MNKKSRFIVGFIAVLIITSLVGSRVDTDVQLSSLPLIPLIICIFALFAALFPEVAIIIIRLIASSIVNLTVYIISGFLGITSTGNHFKKEQQRKYQEYLTRKKKITD